MSEANKAVIMRIFEEALNQGDLDVIDELISPDLVNDSASIPGDAGLEAAKQEVIALRAAFPDLRYHVHDQIAEGDKVVNRFTITGTHTGAEFMGIPPSGKRIEVKGLGIDRLANGIVVEAWDVEDTHALLQQLGAGPG